MFTNAYADVFYELEHVRSATKRLRVILDAKYIDENLNKVLGTQCQYLKKTKCNELIKLLQKPEEFFDGTLGTWKTDIVDF